MSELLIGYARVSTDERDLAAHVTPSLRSALQPSGIYVDHGLTETNRDRRD